MNKLSKYFLHKRSDLLFGTLLNKTPLHRVANLCLFMQMFSLGIAVYYPVSSAIAASTPILNVTTQPYILAKGETPQTVAEKLGIPLSKLYKLNQFRSFHKSFYDLSGGDEIDIPASNNYSFENRPLDTKVDNNENYSANKTKAAVNVSESNKSPEALGVASSMASSAANNAIQKWLSQWGTVESQLSFDSKASLKNSSLDWLIPIYDTDENTWFIQAGGRNKDSRNTVNLGWGVRHVYNGWMYGLNNFFDYDITGNNRRLGLGVEARTDYLSIASNAYLRMNNWHQSRDFYDYDERPANGFDMRVNGWLPAYPQIGGKLVYEQYYGDEVGLFGKDDRQKDPKAITAGVSWTPFPLLSLGVDHKIGQAGKHDTSVNLQLTWRPSDSLSSQLMPDNVAASRLLSKSRYDLVDRNNNIVLEYRKQQLISLKLSHGEINAPGGTSHTIIATVAAKSGLSDITWNAANFIAAGGKIKAIDKTVFAITLPPYINQGSDRKTQKSGAQGGNAYTLIAVAQSDDGSISEPKELHVNVLPPNINFNGDLQISNNNAMANGVNAINVAAVIADDDNNPLRNQRVLFSIKYPSGDSISKESITNDRGIASVDITSTIPGVVNVTATINGISKSIDISFENINIAVDKSQLTVDPAMIIADGKSTARLTFKARDAIGNPITSIANKLSFSASGAANALTISTPVESPASSGDYIATIQGTKSGNVIFSPSLNNSIISGLTASLTLIPDSANPDTTQSTLTAAPATIVANGLAKSLLTLTLKDGNGNLIDGQTVTFSSSLANTTFGSVTDNHDGTYSAELAGTTAGTASVSAQVNGQPFAVTPASVTLTADAPDAAQSTLTAAPATIVANGLAKSLLTLTLKDGNGNPIDGQTVTFSSPLANTTFGSVTDNHDGTYSAELAGTTAGAAAVSAQLNGQPFAVSPASVTLTADAPDAAQSTLTAAPTTIVANGLAKSLLTLTLKDGNGNPVDGQTVTFSSPLANTTFSSVTDNHDGTYSAELAGTTTGTASVSARVNGQPFAVTPASVTLTADAPDAAQSTLTAAPATIVANGLAKSLLTLTLKDGNGNPIDGQTVTFNSTLANTTFGSVTDNHDGTYSAELAGTTTGTASVSARVNGQPFAVTPASVTLTADAPDAAQSTLTAAPATIVANGLAKSLLTLTLKDGNGNLIDGQTVTFSSSLANTTFGSVTDNHDGTYSAELAGTTAGTASVSAQVNGQPFAVTPASVTLTADAPDAAQSTLTAAPATIVANGLAKSLLTLTLKDGNGNLIDGQTVTFSSTLANTTFGSVTDNHDGTYSAELAGTTAGAAAVSARVNGQPFAVSPASITLTADAPDAAQSTLTAAPPTIVANGLAKSLLTLTLKDGNGNLIDGQTVTFSSSLANTTFGSVTDNHDGTYSAELAGTTAGAAAVSAQVNGQPFAVSPASVTLTADAPDAAQSTLTAAPPTIVANGVAKSLLTLTLKDGNGNPVDGQTVTFSSTLANTTFGSVTDNHDGTYSAELAGTKVGTTSIGVQVGGVTFAVAPVTILLTPGPVSATSSLLSSSTNTILSDGIQTATLTYIARDTYGNAIDNLTLTSSVTGTIASGVALSGWTNTGDGLYTATISSHVAGSVSIAPMQNGTIVAQSPVDLAFVDISPNNYFKVSIERGPAAGIPANGPYPADGVTIVPFKIKVVNIDGNPVSGVAITLSTVAASQTIQIVNPSGITDANGVYDGAYATNLITSGVDLGKTYVSKMSVELVDHPMFNATVGILWRRVVP